MKMGSRLQRGELGVTERVVMAEKRRKLKLVEWGFEGRINGRRKNILHVSHDKNGDKLRITRP
jgi:hypothetical protein